MAAMTKWKEQEKKAGASGKEMSNVTLRWGQGTSSSKTRNRIPESKAR